MKAGSKELADACRAAGAGAGAAASTSAVSLPGSREFAAESRALDTRSLGYRFVKRTFDIAFSACVCAVGLIPGAVLCAFIAADTKGAPIYAHERAGRFGRPIHVLKFRSMVADADDVERCLTPAQIEEWRRERKVTDDPCITKLGSVLRKTSLASVIIGTPGDGESTKSLSRSANSSLDLHLCEYRLGICSANSSHYKPSKFLSIAFSEGVSALRKDFAEWPYLYLPPFRFDRNIAGGGL